MKKLFFLSIAMLCFAITSSAQTTVSELKGTWKINAMQLLGINFDLSTGLVSLDPVLTGEGSATADDLAIMADMMKAQLEPYKSSFIKFENNKIVTHFGETNNEGTYTIIEKEGRQYIQANYINGSVKEIEFTIEGGLLKMSRTYNGEISHLIYKLI